MESGPLPGRRPDGDDYSPSSFSPLHPSACVRTEGSGIFQIEALSFSVSHSERQWRGTPATRSQKGFLCFTKSESPTAHRTEGRGYPRPGCRLPTHYHRLLSPILICFPADCPDYWGSQVPKDKPWP